METTKTVIKGGEWIIKEVNADEIFIPEQFNEEQMMVRDMCTQFVDTVCLCSQCWHFSHKTMNG